MRLQNLTTAMMGAGPGEPMGLHGGEANYILEFTLHVLLGEFAAEIPEGVALRSGGEALWAIRKLLMEFPCGNFLPEQTQQFVSHTKVALRVLDHFGLSSKPKFHELAHMAHLCRTRGSPGNWSVWHEEGLNRWVARIANRAHRLVWHWRVLAEFEQTYGVLSRSKRPRLA